MRHHHLLNHAETGIPAHYHAFIEWISQETGMSDSLLHVHTGMLVLVVARLLTRRSLGTFVPLMWVTIAEMGNEVMDRLWFGNWNWPDTSSDIANTLFWPALISIAVRLRPMIDGRVRRRRGG
ncbi:hypothetical protein [Stakelama marina]|uniref:Uncharacterized protein n=1 Tax=Stakelama marina TaxID=2826939 RepID=A0A8T4ILE3_9SPHN|nr:hypothetical protein [Stakelama marina]MBR0553945.1 hypothetical protein [Stakelama marina]